MKIFCKKGDFMKEECTIYDENNEYHRNLVSDFVQSVFINARLNMRKYAAQKFGIDIKSKSYESVSLEQNIMRELSVISSALYLDCVEECQGIRRVYDSRGIMLKDASCIQKNMHDRDKEQCEIIAAQSEAKNAVIN